MVAQNEMETWLAKMKWKIQGSGNTEIIGANIN